MTSTSPHPLPPSPRAVPAPPLPLRLAPPSHHASPAARARPGAAAARGTHAPPGTWSHPPPPPPPPADAGHQRLVIPRDPIPQRARPPRRADSTPSVPPPPAAADWRIAGGAGWRGAGGSRLRGGVRGERGELRDARGAPSHLRSPHPPPPLPPFWTAPPTVHSVCTSVCAGCTAHPHRGGCGQHGRHGLRRSPPPPKGDPPDGRQLSVPGGPRRRTAVQRPDDGWPRGEPRMDVQRVCCVMHPHLHINHKNASADRPGGRHRCPAIRVGQSGGGARNATVPERWVRYCTYCTPEESRGPPVPPTPCGGGGRPPAPALATIVAHPDIMARGCWHAYVLTMGGWCGWWWAWLEGGWGWKVWIMHGVGSYIDIQYMQW